MMARPDEHITRMTAKATGIKLTGEWNHCPAYDAKAASRASTWAALPHVDPAGPMPVTSLGSGNVISLWAMTVGSR